jgi:hypothetical protein
VCAAAGDNKNMMHGGAVCARSRRACSNKKASETKTDVPDSDTKNAFVIARL